MLRARTSDYGLCGHGSGISVVPSMAMGRRFGGSGEGSWDAGRPRQYSVSLGAAEVLAVQVDSVRCE